MKNIFNNLTENNLNSFRIFKTFFLFNDSNVISPKQKGYFNQSDDDLYLSNKIKSLDNRMSLLKKRKQELIYQLPEKKKLLDYQKKYPFLNSYHSSRKIVNVTSRNLSETINNVEYNFTSPCIEPKPLLTDVSPSRINNVTYSRFNQEEFQKKRILEDNMKKLKKLRNYTVKVKKLHNFNFLFKELSLTQRNTKRKFVPKFDFKRVKHHKNERKSFKKTESKHFKKKSSTRQSLEKFFLTDLTSASLKEMYPDAISISKENNVNKTKLEIGRLREGLKPVKKKVLLAPVKRTLEKIYKTDNDLEGKIKEAKLDKSIPLKNYQNKLLKLVEKTISSEQYKKLTGKFIGLDRLTNAIEPLPAFKVDHVFDKDNYLNELKDIEKNNFKKNRNGTKKFMRLITLPSLN